MLLAHATCPRLETAHLGTSWSGHGFLIIHLYFMRSRESYISLDAPKNSFSEGLEDQSICEAFVQYPVHLSHWTQIQDEPVGAKPSLISMSSRPPNPKVFTYIVSLSHSFICK